MRGTWSEHEVSTGHGRVYGSGAGSVGGSRLCRWVGGSHGRFGHHCFRSDGCARSGLQKRWWKCEYLWFSHSVRGWSTQRRVRAPAPGGAASARCSSCAVNGQWEVRAATSAHQHYTMTLLPISAPRADNPNRDAPMHDCANCRAAPRRSLTSVSKPNLAESGSFEPLVIPGLLRTEKWRRTDPA
jgi:hypothetical protein